MKLPRWLVFTLFAACVLVGVVPVYSWILWPERSARQFLSLIEHGDFDQAGDLVLAPAELKPDTARDGWAVFTPDGLVKWSMPIAVWQHLFQAAGVEFDSKNVDDVLHGRQRFKVVPLACELCAQKGEISVVEMTSRFSFEMDRLQLVLQRVEELQELVSELVEELAAIRSEAVETEPGRQYRDRLVREIEMMLANARSELVTIQTQEPLVSDVDLVIK